MGDRKGHGEAARSVETGKTAVFFGYCEGRAPVWGSEFSAKAATPSNRQQPKKTAVFPVSTDLAACPSLAPFLMPCPVFHAPGVAGGIPL